MKFGRPRGPSQAKILIVGEAFGQNEEAAGVPFVGESGKELGRMLSEAGISESDCRFTNVLNTRPPNNDFESTWMFSSKKAAIESKESHEYINGRYCKSIVVEGIRTLQREIETCDPNVIVPLGNIPLWATTGYSGITKWRRSEISARINNRTWKVVPTYHPAYILRSWEERPIAVQDFRIIRRESDYPDVRIPAYDFLLRPNLDDVLEYVLALEERLPAPIAVDIETRSRQIACIGLARSPLSAICIPIQSVESSTGSYWTIEEEVEIVWTLKRLLTKAHVIGQNFHYDNQYFARNYGFLCNLCDDTIHKQAVAFPGLPKGLDFLSSMYREHHTYWKDEGKNWDPRTTGEDQLWSYNCMDAVATYECNTVLEAVVSGFKLLPQYRERLLTQRNALTMMLRGVNSDMTAKLELSSELHIGLGQLRKWWDEVVGYDIFGADKKKKPEKIPGISSKKAMKLCYEVFDLPKKFAGIKSKRRLTANKEAMQEWEETCDPIIRPLLAAIRHYRSMLVFKSTFADQPLDHDNRWRCTNNAGLADTFRWTTSEDAFGFGTNLQNIPKGDER